MGENSAIIIVDMIYDFIDGSLACLNADNAVKNTDAFLAKATGCADSIDADGISGSVPVAFIRDHHPENHCSFTDFGGIWPVHCVAGTRGGEIHSSLVKYVKEELVFDKGCDPDKEQYSGYEGRNAAEQSLGEVLGLLDVTDCYICGIATEYCVRNTAEDLLKAGFKVHVLKNCVAYVDEAGHKEALAAMISENISVE